MTREVALLKGRNLEVNSRRIPMLMYVPQHNNSAMAFCHKESESNISRWKCGLNNSTGDMQKGTFIVVVRGFSRLVV